MWKYAGLIRTAAGLDAASKQLKQWWPAIHTQFADVELNETRNMLLIAAMMVEAASARLESRGCHYRQDCPDPDLDLGRRHIDFQKGPSLAEDAGIEYPQPYFADEIISS
jgi:L-aspartate oxidase